MKLETHSSFQAPFFKLKSCISLTAVSCLNYIDSNKSVEIQKNNKLMSIKWFQNSKILLRIIQSCLELEVPPDPPLPLSKKRWFKNLSWKKNIQKKKTCHLSQDDSGGKKMEFRQKFAETEHKPRF